MKKMRGRPRIGGEKTENFMLRISPEEKKMLEFVSWKTGKSRAEVLRSGLIDQYTREQSRDWNILYIHFVRPFGVIFIFVYTFYETIWSHFIFCIYIFGIIFGHFIFVYTNFLTIFDHFWPFYFVYTFIFRKNSYRQKRLNIFCIYKFFAHFWPFLPTFILKVARLNPLIFKGLRVFCPLSHFFS